MTARALLIVVLAAAAMLSSAIETWAGQAAGGGAHPVAIASDISSQQRRARERAPTRIEVRPLRGPVVRECVPVFQERWIPQWGGRVLYASQRCWWTRG